MKEKLVVTSLFNCGVFIKSQKATILVDGINKGSESFDGLSESAIHKLMNCEEPFGVVDYLLFTHDHKDHLDRDRLREYIRKNRVRGIFIPGGNDPPKGQLELGESTLTYFRTTHLAPIAKPVDHCGLLLEIGGKKIYFSGDSEFRTMEQTENLRGISVDIAFYNPFHLNMPAGRDIMKSVNAKHNFIYHLPPEEKDQYAIRKRALNDFGKYREDLSGLKLILKPMEICYSWS